MNWSRRSVILGGASLLAAPAAFAQANGFAAIEAKTGGRLGVSLLDTSAGKRFGYRSGELFPMCSTFKLLAVAAVLARVDKHHERLDHTITYGFGDLLDYAPVTRAHITRGALSVQELCAAAITVSDNTAANLLLNTLGGPGGVTNYVRTLGDQMTRLDRNEPSVNTAIPGDIRDTTTPDAMVQDMQQILCGSALSPDSQRLLTGWMQQCQTADGKIPAGLPLGWRSGNKTGNGQNGTVNDVAILTPPIIPYPVLLAVYYTGSTAPQAQRDGAIAAATKIAIAQLG